VSALAVSEADQTSFVRARPRLFGIARRVLGSEADAHDVVQAAWMRWQETDRTVVRDATAFLAATTMRLALNVGASARVRRETYVEPPLIDAVDDGSDPSLDVERRAEVSAALLRVLQKLPPTERAVYLLREAFDYPYRQAGAVLGLSEANARQLVTRARRRLADSHLRPVDASEHEQLVEVFLAAAESGEMSALETFLGADTSVALAA
jgi:RNA polymerase sigma-70 factor (ECF subfamily)